MQLQEFLLTLTSAELVQMASEALTCEDVELASSIREILKSRKSEE